MKTSIRSVLISLVVLLAVSVLGSGNAAALSLSNLLGSPVQATTSASDQPCFVYTNHVYEVCTAYVANSSLAVLVPYYQYAHSPNQSLAGFVSYRLGQRYTGQAYNLMTARVAKFGSGNNDVSLPSIKIVSATSSLTTNTATLVTVESWLVKSESEKVVYQENNVRHTVTMQRVPSYILHKWVVTDIR